ncbi:polyprenyl synthetase family protein [Tundrisphaera sp. TA3]|uniref:polyprenyl synthetase family protein n=1 Tax=Tundrisphaera sp. TA3 TaxID=3435775 RepID=UPI003EB8792E
MASAASQAEDTGRKLKALYAPIAAEMAEAERVFAAELGSRHPFVQHLVDHCADFRGKRLRPALVLLTAKACGGVRPAHPVLAAVVEMVHTATLVHDDILDESLVRRHAATVNAEWGNEAAVLMGDYLFTHAFHLAASLETTLACRWIGHATNLVCEGEMQQVHNRGNLDLDEDAYFAIIRGKTAELTAVSCRLGAHYAGASEQVVEAFDNYGRDLGVAFQIADDVLDIWGEERATGKSLGTDLEKQKLTLPLIRLLATLPRAEADDLRHRLGDASPEFRRELRPRLEASGALDYAWEQAKAYAARAAQVLDLVPDSPSRAVLQSLTYHVVRRSA